MVVPHNGVEGDQVLDSVQERASAEYCQAEGGAVLEEWVWGCGGKWEESGW